MNNFAKAASVLKDYVNLRQVGRPERLWETRVLAFHSAAGSGCGSVLTPFGAWMGRGAAIQRDEGRCCQRRGPAGWGMLRFERLIPQLVLNHQ